MNVSHCNHLFLMCSICANWDLRENCDAFVAYYARPLIGESIKLWRCLTSVAYIQPTSRTERPSWYRGSPRHTWLGYHFQGQKVKSQGHQPALLTVVLARQAAAAVGVGTCWSWETAATLPSARRREALRHPWGRRGAGHIVAAAGLQLVSFRAHIR